MLGDPDTASTLLVTFTNQTYTNRTSYGGLLSYTKCRAGCSEAVEWIFVQWKGDNEMRDFKLTSWYK